jgi:quercetin dioxygenase-like cupin family protein
MLIFLLAWELEFTLEGKTKLLKEGEGVIVRSKAEHGVRTLGKPVKGLDAWYPRREDY